MSLAQAKALIEKMMTDKAFSDQVMAIENVKERLAFIKKAGFDFTKEEILAAKDELSDDQKEAAGYRGGSGLWTGCKGLYC